MNPLYSAEVTFADANELISSLYAFTNKKGKKKLTHNSAFLLEVQSSVSPKFLAELDSIDFDFSWVHLLIWQRHRQEESCADFLRWFEGLQAETIIDLLSPWMNCIDHKSVEELRSRLFYFLSEWNEQYFAKVDPAILVGLRNHVKEKACEEEGTPMEYAERITNGLVFQPLEGLKKILLVPQYHNQPYNFNNYLGTTTICTYFVEALPKEPTDLPDELFRMSHCLGEKNRLKIMQFIEGEPKTFTQIVQFIGLAKSTVHEHLLILRSAGFIRAYIEGESVVRYDLRKSGVGNYLQLIEKYYG